MKKSRLENYINDIKLHSGKVLSVFITCGFPSPDRFEELVLSLFEAGADMIELGVPFSDPIADGSIIQLSSQQALLNGINLEKTLLTAEKIKSQSDKPIILMGYSNPFLSYGISDLAKSIKEIGIDGIIVPDVPIEEYDDFFEDNFNEVDIILLVSPTTPKERVIKIGNKSSGFVYCISVKGITGKQQIEQKNSLEYVRDLRYILKHKNILVGFGISNEQTAYNFSRVSDGVIIGSAVIKLLLNSNGTNKETLDFIKRVKNKISN